MIASLGMYDTGDCVVAHDRYWALIRDSLHSTGEVAPETLTRGDGAFMPAWLSPDLVLSQTCGYPFRTRLQGHVTYVGTPDYGLPGCPQGFYNSVFLARIRDTRHTLTDFNGAGLAFNDDLSQSGWAAPVTHMTDLGLSLVPVLRSGSHRLSAQAVMDGNADIAAIDAVTWRILARNFPGLAQGLRAVGTTTPTPGLPYITAKDANAPAIFAAIAWAIAALTPADRVTLGLGGIVEIPAANYLAVLNPPAPAHFGLPV